MKHLILFIGILAFVACKEENPSKNDTEIIEAITADIIEDEVQQSVTAVKQNLQEKGYQVFDYVDPKSQDTILMQQYFMAFLKKGPSRSQTKEEADSLQKLHLAHLGRMYEEGFADISGPFGDDGEIRGITIYNVPTLEMADSLANMDPMVKAGRLVIEIHPWWAAKGFPLR
ncbi:Uncharacterized conserved protein YciI, contains a putative active-site phosphohistidine [Zhouia amylolytica]|uniref:Uncharacterized conserved protein YciI, contains a putative active-site phosphohistidine n=1 Tax=Zhouia amylolytica TaxID=376730 RepID=A0A1I6SEI1_9FLAO|nr:YciI family protein [Zhouia amylolytica]SFS75324.1 Uncharacterized conserved protein YciI, contains a putative active-site phosphohistidine [Zhouia amylolytica]